ncbi:aminoglycoside phosphotransferase family protein [Nocardia sp. NBC_01730]|uniref:phosphotransferase family protein n=1 Tax=Nocardia sp. NBC_01730 TaxID=2975998 RepID=UPI002E12993D|nr:aminoglycoside phosphotransferase family protein [Nocardia sp. NBC_01730]
MTAPDPRAGVREFLRRQGLLRAEEYAELTPLTGGVSSDLWKVDLPTRTVCVKGALAQLEVAHEWLAPVSRNQVEYDWLQFAAPVCPGHVPQVIAHDAEAGLFAMEFLPPERYPVWKAELLGGHVDVAVARAVGDLVGRLHSASAADSQSALRFATDDNFDALRIEPFLRVTAEMHPDLLERFTELARTTASTHLAVAHGDVSPKNILLGPDGPVLLDAECAWFGDPAFDVAFCLNHLLIKSVKLPAHAAELRAAAQALAEEHARHIDWESPTAFGTRVTALLPALALARIDGTSPVEYLDAVQRREVRNAGRALLADPALTVDQLLDRWASAGSLPTGS